MADPNVTSIVVDGVERWGSADAKWVRDTPAEQPASPAVPTEAQPAAAKETTDAPEDAAPGKDPKPSRSRS